MADLTKSSSDSTDSASSFVDLSQTTEETSPEEAATTTAPSDTISMSTSNTTKSGATIRRVAVVGGGVSGLAAAWHLSCNNDTKSNSNNTTVTLLEADHRLGGHAWTVPVETAGGTVPVDIGFMVLNDDNYPNFLAWLNVLNHHQDNGEPTVHTEASDMSLAVSLDQAKTVEWSSDGIAGLLGGGTHWRQLVSPSFWRFLYDMVRFNNTAADLLALHVDDPRRQVTTLEYLTNHGYMDSSASSSNVATSSPFARYYLLPMMAALWSADDMLNFPAVQLVSFLCHHQMLQLFGRPAWKTVAGRSQSYVRAVQEFLQQNPSSSVEVSTPVVRMVRKLDNNRDGNGKQPSYELYSSNDRLVGTFDDVIFACHTDVTASILEASQLAAPQQLLLSKMEYADNTIYVHSDPAHMPIVRSCWASWNCLGKSRLLLPHSDFESSSASAKQGAFEGASSGFGNSLSTTDDEGKESNGRFKAVYVTYWLNRLQNLKTDVDIFVSLNPHETPDPELVHDSVTMAHPQFTLSTMAARDELLASYQGVDGLWYCGAWTGYGFHEDGCRSGFDVATQLSERPLPWMNNTSDDQTVLLPPDFATLGAKTASSVLTLARRVYRTFTYDMPVAVCQRLMYYFLDRAVHCGTLRLKFNDGSVKSFGDGTPCGRGDSSPVTLRIFDPWFFVKAAVEYDLGLARAYMAGLFCVEPLEDESMYHPVMRPAKSRDETTVTIGDPVGLTRLFLLLIGNRDRPLSKHVPKKAGRGHRYGGAFSNASGLLLAKIGSLFNYIRYKMTMDNSERGGSLKNIHAHYDLSNDLFTTFLDKETLMYSSAIYDAVKAPSPLSGLTFRGSLEEAQWRKLDTLLDRAQVQPGQTLLDIGFGWGGLSIHAAKKYGCKVTGITLSVEQKALAEKRVRENGVESLVTFHVIDYRTFARHRENQGKFDRVLSCEMIEAVGHEHLGEFFWVVEQVLARDGVLVMEAITTPEERYETYLRSTDFINTIIFPGSCCPSLHALVDAAYQQSSLTLEHIDNIGMHYAQTLAEWRRRFNEQEDTVRRLGFDDVFLRAWNYYLSYCESAFFSQTEHCLILIFTRPGCGSIVPLAETRSVTQAAPLTLTETSTWLTDSVV